MSGFPPLPPINDMDMVLAVFTHESLLASAQDDFREPRRLVHLGERVLEQAITYHYFMKKPVMPADEIEVSSIVPFFPDPPESFYRNNFNTLPLISIVCYMNMGSKRRYDTLLDSSSIRQRYVYEKLTQTKIYLY